MSSQCWMKVVPFCLVTWLTDGYQKKYQAPCYASGKPGSDRIKNNVKKSRKCCLCQLHWLQRIWDLYLMLTFYPFITQFYALMTMRKQPFENIVGKRNPNTIQTFTALRPKLFWNIVGTGIPTHPKVLTTLKQKPFKNIVGKEENFSLITNIFSFSHNVFSSYNDKFCQLCQAWIIACKCSQFGIVCNFVFW